MGLGERRRVGFEPLERFLRPFWRERRGKIGQLKKGGQMVNLGVFEVYRNGADGLKTRLEKAVIGFYQRHERLPTLVVVPPKEVRAAQEMLRLLELPRLEVSGCGGCLIPEVWLG